MSSDFKKKKDIKKLENEKFNKVSGGQNWEEIDWSDSEPMGELMEYGCPDDFEDENNDDLLDLVNNDIGSVGKKLKGTDLKRVSGGRDRRHKPKKRPMYAYACPGMFPKKPHPDEIIPWKPVKNTDKFNDNDNDDN